MYVPTDIVWFEENEFTIHTRISTILKAIAYFVATTCN